MVTIFSSHSKFSILFSPDIFENISSEIGVFLRIYSAKFKTEIFSKIKSYIVLFIIRTIGKNSKDLWVHMFYV